MSYYIWTVDESSVLASSERQALALYHAGTEAVEPGDPGILHGDLLIQDLPVPRCKAKTRKGNPCPISARRSGFCHIHEEKAAV